MNLLLYNDLPETTLSERLRKAKLIYGINQKDLARKTGLSEASINKLEAGYRDTININTLKKLLSVLDSNIILDYYLSYILNQGNNIKELIYKYGITRICEPLQCHRSTIDRYRDNKYQIPHDKYEKLKDLL
ncbi:helix-turn-helix domain-containing protein [Clostridium sp. MB05]|uniref:helix-turn-helix domain-containing protein n=1 Tax=Clostridium sp. MB05 TaxID=3376682 RepID=UPI00398258B6